METSGRGSPSMGSPSISDGSGSPSAAGGDQVDPVREEEHERAHAEGERDPGGDLEVEGLSARQQGEVGERPSRDDDRDQGGEGVHAEGSGEVQGEEVSEGAGGAAGRAGKAGERLEEAERERDAVEVEQPDGGARE